MLELENEKRTEEGTAFDTNEADNVYVSDDEAYESGAVKSETDVPDFTFNLPRSLLWSGWEGAAIMVFGVLLPSLIFVAGSTVCYDRIVLLLWKQPVEMIVQLSLALMIPISNLMTWSAYCNKDCRHAIRNGILNGIGIGASAMIAALTTLACVLKFPTVSMNGTPHTFEFGTIAALALFAMASGILIALKVRNTRVVQSSKIRATAYALCGVFLAITASLASETRSTCIKIAEHMATAETADERQRGLDFLRSFNAEKELRMECSNRKAIGLPGLFIRVDNPTLRRLHFAISGRKFGEELSQDFSTMTDEYLKNHVVGEPISGLSLHRSTMFGQINPTTVSSTVYWTFVFKNRNYEDQEARAEIALPEGAVVSGMTVWKEGRPLKTIFAPSGEGDANDGVNWTNIGHEAPGIVTDLGRGRMLLHCYPVPAQGYLRVAMAVTVPLKLHTITDTSLPLPRFMETNFDLKSNEHALRLVSTEKMTLAVKSIKAEDLPNGQHVLTGNLSAENLSGAGLSVRVARPHVYGPLVMNDELNSSPRCLIQTIRELPATHPKRLVVVIDGSESMKEHIDGIKKVLSNLPEGIAASMIFASSEHASGAPQLVKLSEGLAKLSKEQFTGGQDNLQAVVTASGIAAESEKGAVLWLHGPQPGYNQEIYIPSPGMFTPAYYELALDDGVMDQADYFKNHREIGPFTTISRDASPDADLERFFSKWRPGGHDYVVEYQVCDSAPNLRSATADQSRETSALFAKEKVSQLLRLRQTSDATKLAVSHRIVTPVSLATCTGRGESLESEMLANEHGTGNVRIFDGSNGQVTPIANTAAGVIKPSSSNQTSQPYHMANATNTLNDPLTDGPYDPSRAGNGPRPMQGAINGTIGPQDATFVSGVNTAGTVRVNNLSNLEAMLNVFANLMQLVGFIGGAGFLISSGLVPSKIINGSNHRVQRIIIGAILIAGGLLTPGILNYMIASARDANVFS